MADEEDGPESEETPKHILWQAFFKQLPLQNETCMFILIGMMDYFMTRIVLAYGAVESNPIANLFLNRWGSDGMLLLKLLTVTVVVLAAQLIARKDEKKAKRVLQIGSLFVGIVVIYTVALIVKLMSR